MKQISLYVLGAVGAVLLLGCDPDRGNSDGADCRVNADCSSVRPLCFQERVCVECFEDAHCGCHEVCDNNVCRALDATAATDALRAHGVYSTATPGQTGRRFVAYCETDNDCPEAGSLCNPFTAGCVEAASFAGLSCDADADCPETVTTVVGGREVAVPVACEPGRGLCLPQAACRSEHNCCAFDRFACNVSAGLCEPLLSECSPPETLTGTCPQEPKDTSECSSGFFCSPQGRCVECTCDGDCDPAEGRPECHLALGLCVSDDFCITSTPDCEPAQACHAAENLCKPRCVSDADCDGMHTPGEYVCKHDEVPDLENVGICYPRVLLPCQVDASEPNDGSVQAVALVVPAFNGLSVTADHNLCLGDEDWFSMALLRADHVEITGRFRASLGDNSFAAVMELIGTDGATVLEATSLSPTTNGVLQMTVPEDGTYYMRLRNSGLSTGGVFRIELLRTQGTACDDAFEELHGGNNNAATATLLNDSDLTIPTGCGLTSGTVGASHTVVCSGAAPAGAVTLCPYDADFYLVEVHSGAALAATLSNYGGANLDLLLYGPFSALETPVADAAHLVDASETFGNTEQVDAVARPDVRFLLRVKRNGNNGALPYDLQVAITSGPACTEDAFDAVAAGPQFDVGGLNDEQTVASPVAVSPTLSNDFNLTLCQGDTDWFLLGVDGGGAFANLPAGLPVEVELQNVNPPTAQITVAAGSAPDAAGMTLGSMNPLAPARSLLINPTNGAQYYVRVAGQVPASTNFSYTLHVGPPPVCLDDLGDGDPNQFEPRNDAPATAHAAVSWSSLPPFSTLVGASFSFPVTTEALDVCHDQDWYAVSMPASSRLAARITYDPSQSDLGLAIYDATVSGESQPLNIEPPVPPLSRLAISDLTTRPVDRVIAPGAGATRYVVVYNRTGFEQVSYALALDVLAPTCVEEASEDNDTWQTATPIVLTPMANQQQIELAVVDPMAACTPGEVDFLSVPLKGGDQLSARMHYAATELQLDMALLTPGAVGTPTQVDAALHSGQVPLVLQYVVPQGGPNGDYLLRVDPTQGGDLYWLDVEVQRNCLDDVQELNQPYTNVIGVPASFSDLKLCSDEDWFRVEVTGNPTNSMITVCSTFVHAEGDIDLEVYSVAPPPFPPASGFVEASYTKQSTERIELPAVMGQVYYVRVFLDPLYLEPRGTVDQSYNFEILDDAVPCP